MGQKKDSMYILLLSRLLRLRWLYTDANPVAAI
jgi:hypothetical protein